VDDLSLLQSKKLTQNMVFSVTLLCSTSEVLNLFIHIKSKNFKKRALSVPATLDGLSDKTKINCIE
jgi:hypothetical protein